MRPITVSVGASASSQVVPLDIYQTGNVNVQLQNITGTPDVSIEWTNDDIWAVGYDPDTGNWSDSGLANLAADGDGGVLVDAGSGFPITPRAIRATNAAAASTADVTIVQNGVMG
jgi:hypothetical protein